MLNPNYFELVFFICFESIVSAWKCFSCKRLSFNREKCSWCRQWGEKRNKLASFSCSFIFLLFLFISFSFSNNVCNYFWRWTVHILFQLICANPNIIILNNEVKSSWTNDAVNIFHISVSAPFFNRKFFSFSFLSSICAR